jgi:hypothetical protein
MKLCFVSVNGPREPYLLDEPRITVSTNFANACPVTQYRVEYCQFPEADLYINDDI